MVYDDHIVCLSSDEEEPVQTTVHLAPAEVIDLSDDESSEEMNFRHLFPTPSATEQEYSPELSPSRPTGIRTDPSLSEPMNKHKAHLMEEDESSSPGRADSSSLHEDASDYDFDESTGMKRFTNLFCHRLKPLLVEPTMNHSVSELIDKSPPERNERVSNDLGRTSKRCQLTLTQLNHSAELLETKTTSQQSGLRQRANMALDTDDNCDSEVYEIYDYSDSLCCHSDELDPSEQSVLGPQLSSSTYTTSDTSTESDSSTTSDSEDVTSEEKRNRLPRIFPLASVYTVHQDLNELSSILRKDDQYMYKGENGIEARGYSADEMYAERRKLDNVDYLRSLLDKSYTQIDRRLYKRRKTELERETTFSSAPEVLDFEIRVTDKVVLTVSPHLPFFELFNLGEMLEDDSDLVEHSRKKLASFLSQYEGAKAALAGHNVHRGDELGRKKYERIIRDWEKCKKQYDLWGASNFHIVDPETRQCPSWYHIFFMCSLIKELSLFFG